LGKDDDLTGSPNCTKLQMIYFGLKIGTGTVPNTLKRATWLGKDADLTDLPTALNFDLKYLNSDL